MDDSHDGRPLSGCMALKGCLKQVDCQRHIEYQQHPLVGFHAHHMCRLSQFVENHYPFFISGAAHDDSQQDA